MKKIFLSLLVVLLPMVAMADAVEIDGIYYNLISKAKEAEVTSNPNSLSSNGYTGNVVIPSTVFYDGTEYNVTSIDIYAFNCCSELNSITIPSSVTQIKKDAFYGCGGLSSVFISDLTVWCSIQFPNSHSSPLLYAQKLYLNGEEIKELIIPNSVTSIGSYTFYCCNSLTSVTIPNSVTSIGEQAFSNCRNITSVIISNSVTSIGGSTFAYCTSLTSINIPEGLTTIGGGVFCGCSSLASITIPNSIKSIGQDAFYGCSCLSKIIIPNNVKTIGLRAFSRCSNLTSITIGSSVNRILNHAFYLCQEITDVYCLAESIPSTSNDAFEDSYINYTTLHVPAGSVDAYKTTEPWKNFKEIVPLDGQSIESLQYTLPTGSIDIYSVDGKHIGSAADQSEAASLVNQLPAGTVTIVRIGEKSVKVVVK